jgi:hypothetical protein
MELFQVAKSYSFSDVQVVVGGLRIAGYDEGGGISIDFGGDIASMKQGADGEVTVSKQVLPPAVATITLMETSNSNLALHGLLVAQREAPAGFILPFAMVDLTTGESLLSGQCVFLNLPGMNKQREAGSREWKLGLPTYVAAYAGTL